MKVNCPNCKGRGMLEYGGSSIECVNCGASGEFDLNIPTAQLIQELEARRPKCDDCKYYLTHSCIRCIWMNEINADNFKSKDDKGVER